MEEAPENGKESLNSANPNGMSVYSHHSCYTHQSTFVQTWHPQPCPNGCSPQRYSSSNVVETLPSQIKHSKTAALLLGNGHPGYLLGALQISIVNSLLSP